MEAIRISLRTSTRVITLEARAEWNATKISVADGKKELNCVLTVQVWKPAAWVFARSLLIRLGFGHGHTCGELVSSSTRLTATASFFFVRSSSSIRSIRTEPTTSYSHPTASTRCECSTVRSTVAAQRKWRSFVMVISTMFFFLFSVLEQLSMVLTNSLIFFFALLFVPWSLLLLHS